MDEKKFEERLEQIIKDAEEKINKLDDKFVEDKLKNFGDDLEKKLDEKFSCRHTHRNSRRSSEFWGFVLVGMGFIFLADNLRWVHWDLPFWPMALIILGAYLIYQSINHD